MNLTLLTFLHLICFTRGEMIIVGRLQNEGSVAVLHKSLKVSYEWRYGGGRVYLATC